MSRQDAEQFRTRFFCDRVSHSDESDPLLDLCINFDLNTVSIGGISFCPPSEFDQDHWTVGHDEADPIVYPKDGGTISVRDHGKLTYEICKCARTPEGFLSALLVVAEHNDRTSEMPDESEEKMAAGREALLKCISYAGNETESFYRTLMYVWD